MFRQLSFAALSLLLVAGCTNASGSTPPACGSWEEVDLDQRIGPEAISANDAYALIEGKHVIPGPQGEALFVDIVRGSEHGHSRAQIASPDRSASSLGACGMRLAVSAHLYDADRHIDVNVPVARLSLHDKPRATFEARLPHALPAPYASKPGVNLAVSMDLNRTQKPKLGAQLRMPSDREPTWSWGDVR